MKRTALALDHVLLSGGTTYGGRGWYDEAAPTLKAGGAWMHDLL